MYQQRKFQDKIINKFLGEESSMSTVLDRNVIDNIIIEESNIILTINDHLQWNCVFREQHAVLLKNKTEDYINFIQSGQLNEYCLKQQNCDIKDFEKIIIKVYAKYSYSKYCIDFFGRVKKVVNDLGYEFVWDNSNNEKNEEAGYFYVVEHEDVTSGIIEILKVDKNNITIRWSGTANIFWNSEFGENVPFDTEFTTTIPMQKKYKINALEKDSIKIGKKLNILN